MNMIYIEMVKITTTKPLNQNNMEKEFLDYLYKLKALIQLDIDRLIELNKQPIPTKCKDCGSEVMAELRTRRSQLSSLDETIEMYIKIHY